MLSDEELMQRVQRDEPQRFGELAARYRSALVKAAEGRLGNRAWAEDAAQETLLAAYKSRHTFDPQWAFRTWLWTILFNHCKAVWLRHARRPATTLTVAPPADEATGEVDEPAGREPPPWAMLLAAERRQQVEALLATLSREQAGALRLRFFSGLKFQEIAAAMDCSLATAKNRVRWGLERLAVLCGTPADDAALGDASRRQADVASENHD